MDKIIIKGLRVFARHGVNPEEKENGQLFVLDITLYIELEKPCQTDFVGDTVSYAAASKTVRRAMTEQSFNLIERAAQVVAEALFTEYPRLAAVDVLLKKPQAPVKARFEYMAVELHRERKAL